VLLLQSWLEELFLEVEKVVMALAAQAQRVQQMAQAVRVFTDLMKLIIAFKMFLFQSQEMIAGEMIN
jgi:hypothetical protein